MIRLLICSWLGHRYKTKAQLRHVHPIVGPVRFRREACFCGLDRIVRQVRAVSVGGVITCEGES